MKTRNPGAICANCKYCHVPRGEYLEDGLSFEAEECRAPGNVKIAGIGHADACPGYER